MRASEGEGERGGGRRERIGRGMRRGEEGEEKKRESASKSAEPGKGKVLPFQGEKSGESSTNKHAN